MLIYSLLVGPYRTVLNPRYKLRPLASEVVRAYIRQRKYPSWTSFFLPYGHIQDNDFGEKHFNFDVDGHNYHVLRIGCFPYIKYHCTRRPYEDLSVENRVYKAITVANLGIPCLLYGLAAVFLIRHTEHLKLPKASKPVPIHFLIREDHDQVDKTFSEPAMGPSNPLEYSPTIHLVLGLLFFVFPLIYFCCRATHYLMFEFFKYLRFLLLPVLQLLFYDDFGVSRRAEEKKDSSREDEAESLIDEAPTPHATSFTEEEFTETEVSDTDLSEAEEPPP
ncbi:hypothetical protein AAVH_09041 [Aphelenchoides avenae]|nr:hypothetical protein AAVH_09041 [Aphelenchus avenae]